MEGDTGAGDRILFKWILQKQDMHISAWGQNVMVRFDPTLIFGIHKSSEFCLKDDSTPCG